MNDNKTAIEHVDKWLREKMKGEEVRGLRYEALLDCLQQVEFRAEEEARALESSQTEKDKGLVEALEKLARLGNGDEYGNSDGNRIAQEALSRHQSNPIDPNSKKSIDIGEPK